MILIVQPVHLHKPYAHHVGLYQVVTTSFNHLVKNAYHNAPQVIIKITRLLHAIYVLMVVNYVISMQRIVSHAHKKIINSIINSQNRINVLKIHVPQNMQKL